MSFKALDYTPPKLDLTDPITFQPDPATNDKLRADAQPAKVEATGPNGAKGDVQINPYAQAFNGLEVTPRPEGKAGAKTGDVVIDPFDSRFNTTPKGDKTPQPGRSTTDPVLPEVTDPFAPKFSILPKPGDTGTSPQTLEVDPFDPFRDWSKVPGVTKPLDGPPNANVDPFDPMSDWSRVPGLEPRTPPAAGPTDKPPSDRPVTPQDTPPKPADVVPKRPANPVFNENNVGDAIKLAQSQNQPIYVFSSPNGQLDQTQQAAMQANAGDAVFVNINFANADQMMRAGLETTNYWQLANLCGAGGDVNNLYQKPGFIGRFSATDFNPQDPQNSLKAKAVGDVQAVFAGQVKPPSPAPDAPSRGLDQASPSRGLEQQPPGARRAEATAPGVFTENNVQAATKVARDKNVPMLSYLESAKAPNPNLAKAMQYLSENGLASTVKVSRPRAERMLQDGLETSKFYALKDAMLRTPDVAKDGSSHLSAFAPANLRPGSRFAPSNCTEAAKSPDQIVSFLKASGVDLSKNNSEAAVRALLEGKPVPPPPEPVKEKDVKPAPPAQPTDAPAAPPQAKPADAPVVPPQTKPADAPVVPPQVRPADAPVQPEVKKPVAVNPEPEATPARSPDQPPVQPESTPIRPRVRPSQTTPVQPPAQPETAPIQPAARPRETTPAAPQVREKEAAGDVTPVKPEGTPEAQPKTPFKVKTAAEALKVIEDAKKRNLDLVVYSPTVICTDQTCTMTKLDATNPASFADKAIFLELPRGGVDVPAGAEYDALREMNNRHKVTAEDHKSELDIHVYSYNKDKSAYELNDGASGTKKGNITGSNFDASGFLRARLAKTSK